MEWTRRKADPQTAAARCGVGASRVRNALLRLCFASLLLYPTAVCAQQTAETIVDRYGVSRGDQDRFAAESQRRAEQAISSGDFKDEIVPVAVP